MDGRHRVVIERVSPEMDCARFAISRVTGEMVVVEADVYADGHDQVACQILIWRDDSEEVQTSPMKPLGNDRWRGSFCVHEVGRFRYCVEGWIDQFQTWRNELVKRVAAGQDVHVELVIGRDLIEGAAAQASGDDAAILSKWARRLQAEKNKDLATAIALEEQALGVIQRYFDRRLASRYDKQLLLTVERKKAGFSTWYEVFPRSCSPEAARHGTFRDCEARLPYIASMGFDVVYFPPIHPIGVSFRKGKNNSVTATQDDVGSPWAIGAAEGGHTCVHPQLGDHRGFSQISFEGGGARS